jgi:hypothetical protein
LFPPHAENSQNPNLRLSAASRAPDVAEARAAADNEVGEAALVEADER